MTRAEDPAESSKRDCATPGRRLSRSRAIAVVDPDDGGVRSRRRSDRSTEYDWAAFTSANCARDSSIGYPTPEHWGPARRGRGTSHRRGALSGHVVADLVAQKSSAAGLVESIGSSGRAETGRLLSPAADALPTLAEGLRSAGWAVDEVETYRTLVGEPEVPSDPDALDSSDPGRRRGLRLALSRSRLRQAAGRAQVAGSRGLHRTVHRLCRRCGRLRRVELVAERQATRASSRP